MILSSCQNKNQISFDTLNLSSENKNDAVLVEINVPNALKETKIAAAINTAIKDEIMGKPAVCFLTYGYKHVDRLELSDQINTANRYRSVRHLP